MCSSPSISCATHQRLPQNSCWPQSPIHTPHTSKAPGDWLRTAGMESVGGCSHGHILQPSSLALALPCREGPRPAAFQALALAQTPATPGSCTCSRTGPGNAGATGINSFLLPLHVAQETVLWLPRLLEGGKNYLPRRERGGLATNSVTLALSVPQFPQMLKPELLGLYMVKLSLATEGWPVDQKDGKPLEESR